MSWGSVPDILLHFSYFLSEPGFAFKTLDPELKFCWLIRNPFSLSLNRWQPNYFLQFKPIASSGMDVSVGRYISSPGPILICWWVWVVCQEWGWDCIWVLWSTSNVCCRHGSREGWCMLSICLQSQNVSHLSILPPCPGGEPVFECWIMEWGVATI